MATFSFDIVSEIDKAEMNNVFLQAEKEIANLYDFKGTPAKLEWLGDKTGFKVIGSNEWQIDTIIDIIRKKLASRSQTSKSLNLAEDVAENNLKATKEIPFIAGLDQEKSKQLTKLLREQAPKVKAQIQGEAVRVTSSSKDELQKAMQVVNEAELDYPVQYINYR